jgi:hypothetical protein
MPPRGKPINPNRAAAIAAGEKFYVSEHPCGSCFSDKRYTKNGTCVECTITRAKLRYSNLTEDGKAAHAARDHDRYLKRLAEGKA